MSKNELKTWIDENQGKFTEISNKIWDFSETGLQEHKSSKLMADTLEEEGFDAKPCEGLYLSRIGGLWLQALPRGENVI